MREPDGRAMRAGIVACPHCMRCYRFEPSQAGREGRCSACGVCFEIAFTRPIPPADAPIAFERPLSIHTTFFLEGCEAMTRNLLRLLEEAGERVTLYTISRFLRDVVDFKADPCGCQYRLDVLTKASGRSMDPDGMGPLAYFVGHVSGMDDDVLRMTEAAICGVLLALDHHPLAPPGGHHPATRWGQMKSRGPRID